jgi:protein disulfide-isomerase
MHSTILTDPRVWNDGRVATALQIDCWADLTCPFCYLAHRRLDLALALFTHGSSCVVVPRAFELDPHARDHYDQPLVELLAHKYHMPLDRAAAFHHQLERQADEIGMRWSMSTARPSNTFDAHRLVKLGTTQGLGHETLERLFAAYFTDGRLLSDRTTLIELGEEVGLRDVADTLSSERFVGDVRADEADAAERDVAGVPYLLIDGKFVVAGARDVSELVAVLERAWRRRDAQVPSGS